MFRRILAGCVSSGLVLGLVPFCFSSRNYDRLEANPVRGVPLRGYGEVRLDPFGAYWPGRYLSYRPARTPVSADRCAPLSPDQLNDLVEQAAREHGIDPQLVTAVIRQESGNYPCLVSPKGAEGLMQLMPDTARSLAVSDPFDARQNIGAGVKLLKNLLSRYEGDLPRALAAYNAGAGAVDRAGDIGKLEETRRYVDRILKSVEHSRTGRSR